jgi:chromosome segregation ATPase
MCRFYLNIMGRRNSFDFAHTCPKIDKAIDSCKDRIESYLTDYINELSPMIPDAEVERIAKEWSKQMYDDISDCFESVRQTNEEMRDEANRQIANLEDELENAKDEVKHLERQLDAVS